MLLRGLAKMLIINNFNKIYLSQQLFSVTNNSRVVLVVFKSSVPLLCVPQIMFHPNEGRTYGIPGLEEDGSSLLFCDTKC